jgi:hypothetical protein
MSSADCRIEQAKTKQPLEGGVPRGGETVNAGSHVALARIADRLDVHGTSAFGVHAIDARLPQGGLVLGALHEVAGGGGNGAVHGAAAALFAAGIMAGRG